MRNKFFFGVVGFFVFVLFVLFAMGVARAATMHEMPQNMAMDGMKMDGGMVAMDGMKMDGMKVDGMIAMDGMKSMDDTMENMTA